MSPSASVLRGAAALHDLQQQTSGLRGLDRTGFRCWPGLHLAHWHRDPIFLQRLRHRMATEERWNSESERASHIPCGPPGPASSPQEDHHTDSMV